MAANKPQEAARMADRQSKKEWDSANMVMVSFKLFRAIGDNTNDQDIIDWLNSAPGKRSEKIKKAIRFYMERHEEKKEINKMTDYQILRQAAESGNREDLAALGRWFEREGREYWNGEYYDADGMEVYPVYKLVDAETEDYEIVGYTTDKGKMFVKVYKVKPEFWSRWGENVDENTIVDDKEIDRLAYEWGMDREDLLRQVEEV